MKRYLIDLAERSTATFGQGFLAVLIAQRNVSEKTALYTGLVAGGLAVAKFLIAKANTFLASPAPPDPWVSPAPIQTPPTGI